MTVHRRPSAGGLEQGEAATSNDVEHPLDRPVAIKIDYDLGPDRLELVEGPEPKRDGFRRAQLHRERGSPERSGTGGHAGLESAHAAEPPVGIGRLALEVDEDIGMRQ